MDYQTFNGHNPSFGAPFSTQPAPQHAHFYTEPQARLQQANPSFGYGQFPSGQAAAFPAMGGAVGSSAMQPGAMPASLNQARGTL